MDSILAAIIAEVRPHICLPDVDSAAGDDDDKLNKLSVEELKQNLSVATSIVQFLSKLLKVSRNKEIFSSIEVILLQHLQAYHII